MKRWVLRHERNGLRERECSVRVGRSRADDCGGVVFVSGAKDL